jgi:murein DD-endopeptidase MepM/ murein hydrolase activator NlpD
MALVLPLALMLGAVPSQGSGGVELQALPPIPAIERSVDTVTLRWGQTLAEALLKVGVSGDQVEGLTEALAGILDFAKVRSGDGLRVERAGEQVTFFELHEGPTAEWCVRREGDRLVGFKRAIAVEKRVVVVDAVLKTSLYEAFTTAGEDPNLALAIADVFAWDIDFYSDPRPGDHIHAVVERREAQGRIVGYGDVLAAEYQGGIGDRQVFRYVDHKGRPDYFDAAGRSARKTFLKSPLQFSHITSHYGMRLHPVLHYFKAHQGVDYGAPIGTPVWAIGDGTVTAAGFQSANGNYVGLRHQNGLETFYCHLSGLAAGIHSGAHVLQKRVIGYVGQSGRATGPHLHFALKRAGQFMNPLALKLPRAEPLAASELPDFRAAIAPLLAELREAPPAIPTVSVAKR